jgi:hypothetical protein
MAALSDTDRAALWAAFQSELSSAREPIAVTKTDLRAAFNGIDDYFEANAAAINAAIPQPARAALTKQQKARIAMLVIRERFLKDS